MLDCLWQRWLHSGFVRPLTCTFQSAQWVTATSRPDSPHIVLTSCVKRALAYWKLHLHASQIIAKEKLHVITHSGIK